MGHLACMQILPLYHHSESDQALALFLEKRFSSGIILPFSNPKYKPLLAHFWVNRTKHWQRTWLGVGKGNEGDISYIPSLSNEAFISHGLLFLNKHKNQQCNLAPQACHNVTQLVEVIDPADKKERVR